MPGTPGGAPPTSVPRSLRGAGRERRAADRRARRPRRRRPRSREADVLDTSGSPRPVAAEPAVPVSDAEIDALAERLPALSLRDEHRLGRRLPPRDAPGTRAPATGQWPTSPPRSTPPSGARPPARPPCRRSATPSTAGQRAARRHRRRDPRPPGRHRRRRDRLREDHAAPEDLPRAGPRRPRPDRAHPAAPARRPHRRRPDRRGAGHRAGRARSAGRSASPTTSASNTLVKLMTDGILLAELTGDRMLRQYDTLIIDEAHERSLNIDFILGYLTQLLPRRPDLKVIITSATIDPERFAEHFAQASAHDGADRRGLRAQLPGRGPLPADRRPRRPGRTIPTATSSTPSATPCPSCSARATATCWCSCPASARSATPPTRWAGSTCGTPRSSRSTPGSRPPSSTGCSPRTPAAGSCWPPTSPRRR